MLCAAKDSVFTLDLTWDMLQNKQKCVFHPAATGHLMYNSLVWEA